LACTKPQMLDRLDNTLELIAVLRAATPFEVELQPSLMAYLRAQGVDFNLKLHHSVSKVSYGGDEGGILCHIERHDAPGALVVSITHLRLRRSLPFAPAVLRYQQHRTKRLKEANRTL